MFTPKILCFSRAIGLAAVATLIGCAAPVTQVQKVSTPEQAAEEKAQMAMAIKTEINNVIRLYRVGYPVLTNAVDQCGDVKRSRLGYIAYTDKTFPEKIRASYNETLGLTTQARVFAVLPKSGAEAGGIMVGDIIKSTSASPPSKTPEPREETFTRLPPDTSVSVTVIRDGKELALSMKPDVICDYPLNLGTADIVNAFADGKQIVITKGMMRFATTDQELALVVSHELGHNTMQHMSKKQQNAGLGAIADVLLAVATHTRNASIFQNAGAQAYSQDFEREADYVGMYYMVRAGYPLDGAADFWRRMAAEHPANIKANHSSSHPATAERFLALDKTAAEIRAKIEAKEALTPNMKTD